MITDVEGVRVGHWTDSTAMTGCTVVLLPEGAVASGEVRGGSPATREFELLDPIRLVTRVDAVVLAGGSAFGLAAADGVMDRLAERGVGFPTIGGVVPIVVGLGLYDLAVGDGSVRPGPASGRSATLDAETSDGSVEVGPVGAGAGATIAKWRGLEHRRPGGIVTASGRGSGGLVVGTIMAVNAFGEPGVHPDEVVGTAGGGAWSNTTIGVVATNARLDKVACHLVAQGAHDGLAHAVAPVHTAVDGDAFVAVATGSVEATLAEVRNLTVAVVSRALRTLAGP